MAFAYPVRTEEEIRQLVSALKEKYYDARHHCYAWRLGAAKTLFRANDDGEPSSTAGKPILGQIQSYDLTDILIVVVRYFGGVKLGVPGLIHAYREATVDAIAQAIIVEKAVEEEVKIRFDYLVLNDVMKIIKEVGAEILGRHFEMECEMLLSIRQKDAGVLKSRLQQVESLILEEEK